ncbi:hypothetical protein FLAG1_07455 [Fusarium langsethiae]|uniref:Uncharacterized protein n=1 Tax=Fusarium langsethiae TaxID=179993 RepID=A0A0M9ETN5_FUSLA|nr:hypothetical protein FLAG1_07455 [Fusarium langsethiae]GKU04796.1 unnamed protein product [Fusarium langsethiae]GKU20593.1 unnamed protein product [Fusarium langsethiae]
MSSSTRPRAIPSDSQLREMITEAFAVNTWDLRLPERISNNRSGITPSNNRSGTIILSSNRSREVPPSTGWSREVPPNTRYREMLSDFQLAQLSCFRRSVLCRDISEGLHNLLGKNRRGHAPDHDSLLQRYHIVRMEGYNPVLGQTMKWETCDREPGVGCCHPDLRCFDPNECATMYMDNFCLKEDAFQDAWQESKQASRVFAVYKDCVPNWYARGWSHAVTHIFRILYTNSSLTDTEWDPTVHGVLYWNCFWGFETFANDLFHEIMAVRTKENTREFCAGRRHLSD